MKAPAVLLRPIRIRGEVVYQLPGSTPLAEQTEPPFRPSERPPRQGGSGNPRNNNHNNNSNAGDESEHEEDPPPIPFSLQQQKREQETLKREEEGGLGGRGLSMAKNNVDNTSIPQNDAAAAAADRFYFLRPSAHVLNARREMRKWREEHPMDTDSRFPRFSYPNGNGNGVMGEYGYPASVQSPTSTSTTTMMMRLGIATTSPAASPLARGAEREFHSPSLTSSPLPGGVQRDHLATSSPLVSNAPCPPIGSPSSNSSPTATAYSPRSLSSPLEEEYYVPKHIPAVYEARLARAPANPMSHRKRCRDLENANEAEEGGTRSSGVRGVQGTRRRDARGRAGRGRGVSSPTGRGSDSEVENDEYMRKANSEILAQLREEEEKSLMDPQRRREIVERMSREWAKDMIDVIRERRYIQRNRLRLNPSGGIDMEAGQPYAGSGASEENDIWREATDLCRPMVQHKLSVRLYELRQIKERALRIKSQRESVALARLARLIASHRISSAPSNVGMPPDPTRRPLNAAIGAHADGLSVVDRVDTVAPVVVIDVDNDEE